MAITLECVTSRDRLAEIAASWQALWLRSGSDIFQHHRWIDTWAEQTADRRDTRLRVMLAWQSEQLVAILPCAIRRVRGLRTLQWAAQDFSDYCDAIVDPDTDWRTALDALWTQLLRRGEIDLVQLRQVRPDARVRRLLARESSALRVEDRHEQCLRIDCSWPNGEAYFRSLNKKGRNNHTRGKRIIEEIGGTAVFRRIEAAEDQCPALDRLLELKRGWMQKHDPNSPLLGRDAALLRAMMETSLAIGMGTIFVIESGGVIVAASLNFLYDAKMQAYHTSYDPAFDRASPGTILIVEYSKWAFDRGLRHVDFLRGDETFKFRLGNAETLLDGFSGGRSVVGHAALLVRDWRERVRRSRRPAVDEQTLSGVEPSLDGR
ncbi:MAG: GNAT family N-acetyltransferase [Acetobacteraceae bacterium]|nr:GNAT family N-acetyltransferase [Acetobacteraceae bacterium]